MQQKPPTPTLSSPVLPVFQTSFIGRRRILNELRCLLGSSPVLTLTGTGGSGKSRLALRLVGEAADRYPGVAWVDLAPVADPGLVPQTIVAALGLRGRPQLDPIDQLSAHLREHPTLLALDNCEHMRAACADLLAALLTAGCPLVVLATSRVPLDVPREMVWTVPQLDLPGHELRSLGDLSEVESVALFCARAQLVAPGFALGERNVAAVSAICRRLDGLPLAIELAAARAGVLTPQQIAVRLDESLRLLTRRSQASESRHQTLRAALDWSLALLPAPARVFFARLGVFAGSFALGAVEGICVGEGIGADELLDLLATLVESSLLATVEQGEEMRYRLLEPVRQYAVELLEAAGCFADWRDCHAAWHLSLALCIERELHGAEQAVGLERLTREHDELRAALAWLHASGRFTEGLRLAAALASFWRVRGHHREGRQWLERLLELAGPDLDPAVHVDALNGLARCCMEQSDFAQGQALYQRSLGLARRDGYERGIEGALSGLGGAYWELADYPAARAALEEAVAHCRACGRTEALCRVLLLLALTRWSQGDIPAARDHCVEALALSRQAGNDEHLAYGLFNLALIVSQQGEYAEARRLYEECIAVNRRLGNRGLAADTMLNLGQMAIDQGDFAAGSSYLEQAAAAHAEYGDRGDIAYSLAGLGDAAFFTGDYELARERYQEALTLFRAADNRRMVGRALHWLSRIACRSGDLTAAAELCAEALRLRVALGHKAGIAFSLEQGAAGLALALGRPATAARLLAVADGLYEEMSRTRPPVEARALAELRAQVVARLGGVAFTAAWGEGQMLGLEQAVAWALEATAPTPALPSPALRVFALGPVRVYRGERLLTSADWTYDKARELVLYLLCRPGASRTQIGAEFWPEANGEQARKRLSTALAHARSALGRETTWIALADRRYRITRAHDCWFDVEVFQANMRAARSTLARGGSPERAVALLEEAVDLYQGDFAEDLAGGEWQTVLAQTLRQEYLEALLSLGQLYALADRVEQALGVYQRAVAQDPYREEAHQGLIDCYLRQNRRGHARRQYEALSAALGEIQATPAPETRALIEQLASG